MRRPGRNDHLRVRNLPARPPAAPAGRVVQESFRALHDFGLASGREALPAILRGVAGFVFLVRVCPDKYLCLLCVYARLSMHNRAHGQARGRSKIWEIKMFTVMGYTINTAEQARTIFLVAKLNGNSAAAEQALALIGRLP